MIKVSSLLLFYQFSQNVNLKVIYPNHEHEKRNEAFTFLYGFKPGHNFTS